MTTHKERRSSTKTISNKEALYNVSEGLHCTLMHVVQLVEHVHGICIGMWPLLWVSILSSAYLSGGKYAVSRGLNQLKPTPMRRGCMKVVWTLWRRSIVSETL